MSGAWQVAVLALWAVVILLLVLTLGFLKRVLPIIEHAEELIRFGHHTQELEAAQGLRPGDTFPDMNLNEADLRLPALFLFVANDCSRCDVLLARLKETGAPPQVRGVPVSTHDIRQALAGLHRSNLPVAYAVDSDRKVVNVAAPAGLDDLHRLAAPLIDHVSPATARQEIINV